MPFFRQFKLVEKHTLVEEQADKHNVDVYAVKEFTFAVPFGLDVNVAYQSGGFIKFKPPGLRKLKAYSPVLVDAQVFKLVVKIYSDRDGHSRYLNQLSVGDWATFQGPGPFRPRQYRVGGKFCFIVCFGVGITEALPMIPALLRDQGYERVGLLWALRSTKDLFFLDELAKLETANEGRFHARFAFSREQLQVSHKLHGQAHGRISETVLKDAGERCGIPSAGSAHDSDVRMLVVGTKTMIRSGIEMLNQMGYNYSKQSVLVTKPLLRCLLG